MIFISSPYTNPDKSKVEQNYIDVSRYAGYLCSQGEVAISPITYGHVLAGFVEMPTDWLFWKNFCLSMLVQCTEMHVLMLEDWSISKGVAGEIEFAMEHNIPVKYIKKQTNYVEQHQSSR